MLSWLAFSHKPNPQLREHRGNGYHDLSPGRASGEQTGNTVTAGTKQHHPPAAAVLEELAVSGIFQYLSCGVIILAPLGVFH